MIRCNIWYVSEIPVSPNSRIFNLSVVKPEIPREIWVNTMAADGRALCVTGAISKHVIVQDKQQVPFLLEGIQLTQSTKSVLGNHIPYINDSYVNSVRQES